ncbi:hypothetical protein FPQ18DRAFT_367905 [Pyronema domesticum]|uniref:Fe2OG dioxygenase domain-containing protein n=1 Tax=Pyronema omphalodes (strain CBS 100304) TaxID=1076935 RepID=U4L5I9_PYROM|nr:hypothetical protein FPQ18DRAFT_367905 [Pyronema domesticum]CCX11408.1 Similar to predicted protein [Laccaria bicolor S238N-H82]; acc. no. XP_001891177 [Pyronema omphalodes CBS 100304]
MGKASKQRKARTKAATAASAPYPPTPLSPTSSSDTEGISSVDLAITTETLEALLAKPALLKSAAHKNLRAMIHKLHAAVQGGEDELVIALRAGEHEHARNLLATIKNPKLGALQRWVRECDAINDGSDECWKTLEAIIRTTTTRDNAIGALARFQPWRPETGEEALHIYRDVKLGKICSREEADHFKASFRVLHTIPAAERKPPNLHPAIIWSSNDNTIPFTPTGDITAIPIPSVPNAIFLQNVLSQTTCRQIIAAAETMGFTPDQAAAGSATELASVLAHNFYWMADEAFCTSLFERVKPFLPATVKGLPVRSINRRFRCYRYVPGAVYRPHVDGAWPPSGITSKGEYVYNASDPEKPEYSRFTFLVYLNDEFEGGETTFFVPAPGEGLEARGVKPMMGSVVVFPHGDAEGSLVHEGTGVTKGAKYIIRTDVVYEVPKSGRAAKE